MFHYRDLDGPEVDVILEASDGRIVVIGWLVRRCQLCGRNGVTLLSWRERFSQLPLRLQFTCEPRQ